MIVIRLLTQTVAFAFTQIWANKIRAMLTCLGIIIGVWAITTVFSAMTGMKAHVMSGLEDLGTNKITIRGQRPDALDGKVRWSDIKMNQRDVAQLRDHATLIKNVTLFAGRGMEVRSNTVVKPGVEVIGIEPPWHEVERRQPIYGRPLNWTDMQEQRDVCLINDLAIDELELLNNGVGEYIQIKGRRFQIVGVVETREAPMSFGEEEIESEVFIPYDTFEKLEDWFWPRVAAEMVDSNVLDEATAEVDFILRRSRNLDPNWPNTWRVQAIQQQLDVINDTSRSMTIIAGVLVGISLLVGGIGIMNIMLVSVSERTREIGLRKAVGANPLVILLQFLIEAVILCIGGGALGLVLAQATTVAMQTTDWEALTDGRFSLARAEIPMWTMLLAVGFSAFVGIVFGLGPALKAARLDPIEALRHD